MHHWSYLQKTLDGQDIVGPISESEFVQAIHRNKIIPTTQVRSETRTSAEWVEAATVPVIAKFFKKMNQELGKQPVQAEVNQRKGRPQKSSKELQEQVVFEEIRDEQREYAAKSGTEKHIHPWFIETAGNTKNIGLGISISLQILGGIGLLVALVVFSNAVSVMHEILGVLVGGFSMLLIMGGAIVHVLSEISRKLGAAFVANKDQK